MYMYIVLFLQWFHFSMHASVVAVNTKAMKDPSVYIFPPKDSEFYNKVKDVNILLDEVNEKVYISAVNNLFSLSLDLKSIDKRIDLSPTEKTKCKREGPKDMNCEDNYIKSLLYDSQKRLYICGTNAFYPECWRYQRNPLQINNSLTIKDAFSHCPRYKKYNALTYFSGDNVFVATQKKPNEKGSSISKVKTFEDETLVSTANSRRKLYFFGASFKSVYSLDASGYIYYFFHEIVDIDLGRKVVYSRVGRVCKYDNGEDNLSPERFITFLKSPLICLKKGDIVASYYDVLESTYVRDVEMNGKTEKFVYATFSSSLKDTANTAVCRYRVSDIVHVFETGRLTYKDLKTKQWVVTPFSAFKNNVSRPVCDGPKEASFSSDHDTEIFNAPDRSLMYDMVLPHDGEALYTIDSARLTAIVVDDFHLEANKTGSGLHVAFAGTSNGHVHKLTINNTGQVEVNAVKQTQPFQTSGPIKVMKLYKNMVYAAGDSGVAAFPVHHCESYWLCKDCVQIKDPYCAWSMKENRCMEATKLDPLERIQDLRSGNAIRCPKVQKDFKCTATVENVTFGMSALLECNPIADTNTGELPTINGWSRSGVRVYDGDMYKLMDNNKKLLITQFTESYVGTYSCIVQVKDSQSKSCSLELQAPTTKRPLVTTKVTERGPHVTNVTRRANTTTNRPAIPYTGSGGKSYFKEFVAMAVLFAIVLLLAFLLFCVVLAMRQHNDSEVDGETANGKANGHFSIISFTKSYQIRKRQNSANKELIKKKNKDRVYQPTTLEMTDKRVENDDEDDVEFR
ncbi:semaphorin-1A-like isoform X1 [Hydractinia symbiolongicarpus]|uniref:semaphorin-1A-like isoform X1 n=1 Tax=Hydractinia symbiolongicarpus TaxID=13093 RepID=UPI00254B744C|nr:semaphorin-1A-like isoform X1 [Hydractinia symbiolongicarpus]